MKTCLRCGTEKEIDDFSSNPNMKSGKLSMCKRCHLGECLPWLDMTDKEREDATKAFKQYAREYNERHPVEKWDDEMVLLLFDACLIPEEQLSTHRLTKVMQEMSPWAQSRKEMNRTRKIEREEALEEKREEEAFARDEARFYQTHKEV